jgi:hypothetical protein
MTAAQTTASEALGYQPKLYGFDLVNVLTVEDRC